MAFGADKQTLEDLNLLGRFKKSSIINIFDRTRTRQGQLLLEQMFRSPLGDAEQINGRKEIFEYFGSSGPGIPEFPFDGDDLEIAESCLNSFSPGNMAGIFVSLARQKVEQSVASGKEYEKNRQGITALLRIISALERFTARIGDGAPASLRAEIDGFRPLLDSAAVKRACAKAVEGGKLTFPEMVRHTALLRLSFKKELDRVLEFIYRVDVCISVASVASDNGFCYPEALDTDRHLTEIEQLFHPAIAGGVANDVRIDREKNIIFLTGANMAGKSTLMKAYGVAVYLAHMGFPVAARSMRFSILDGMFTSINVPDNIDMGYSHFYAEVLRVKTVAREVAKGLNLLVIFDELFKGTNVKDAFDATVAITEALARKGNCSFIISTHIIEAGGELGRRLDNLQFLFLPTVMEGTRPTYTYTLTEGITDDRHGMMIINNEGVVDTILGQSIGGKFQTSSKSEER